jgi:hypothetical protein
MFVSLAAALSRLSTALALPAFRRYPRWSTLQVIRLFDRLLKYLVVLLLLAALLPLLARVEALQSQARYLPFLVLALDAVIGSALALGATDWDRYETALQAMVRKEGLPATLPAGSVAGFEPTLQGQRRKGNPRTWNITFERLAAARAAAGRPVTRADARRAADWLGALLVGALLPYGLFALYFFTPAVAPALAGLNLAAGLLLVVVAWASLALTGGLALSPLLARYLASAPPRP